MQVAVTMHPAKQYIW